MSVTTLRLAEVGLRQMMEGVRPWAAMPDEDRARRTLARLEAAVTELQEVLASW